MSGVLGVLRRTGAPAPGDLSGCVARLAARGAGPQEISIVGAAAVAVCRQEWELAEDFSGPVLVLEEGDLVIAADASLYHRDALRRALQSAGEPPGGTSASHLILAAYRAWGERCAERLDGDLAFVLFDRRAGRMLAVRDYGGSRPLYFADLGDTVVIASTMAAIVAHPACPDTLNLRSIAETAAGIFSEPVETCYSAVSALPAGHTLLATPHNTHTFAHWRPPRIDGSSRVPFRDAALELRDLLEAAVAERLARCGPTTVWMSGGWDSSAVFAAAMARSKRGAPRPDIRPVSISYPPGDPGREDELIQSVAERWNADVHWLHIDDIPFVENPAAAAAVRDDPLGHAYEQWLRRLARGSRAAGSRVALGGYGGDQLFMVSDAHLADLLKSGRWGQLRREWRAKHGRGVKNFLRWAVAPVMPLPIVQAVEALRGGRPIHDRLEEPVPSWIRPDFAKRHDLFGRQRRSPRPYADAAAHEMYWYLTHPFFPRISSAVAGFASDEGVEVRSPLFDRRVIELAVARPASERSRLGERKRLLRAAMSGLLPDPFLAPRQGKTGVTAGYFQRSMRAHLPAMLESIGESPILAEHGIVDAAALWEAGKRYLRGRAEQLGAPILFTIQTELWLRAREGVGGYG
jgi:asparagine synthase (glutamine-hydrolysing)